MAPIISRSLSTDPRLAKIAGKLSDELLELARADIVPLLEIGEAADLKGESARSLRESLPAKWAPEFRRHLVKCYTDDLNIAVDDAINAHVSRSDPLAKLRRKQRAAAQDRRWKAGVGFLLFGVLVLFANLLVVPIFSSYVATAVEHKAATELQKLSATLISQGTKLTADLAKLDTASAAVNSLGSHYAELKSSVDTARFGGVFASPDSMEMVTRQVQAWLERNATKQGSGPASAEADSVKAIKEILTALQAHAKSIQAIQKSVTDASAAGGVVSVAKAQLEELGRASGALAELSKNGGSIADKTKEATEGLSSASKLIAPFTYALLVLGVSLVTIGITSILRSLKHADEPYEEADELGRTLLMARLAVSLQAQGIKSEALIERLARLGDPSRKPDSGIPLPLARALSEVAKSLKK